MSYNFENNPMFAEAMASLKSRSWEDAVERFTSLIEATSGTAPSLFLKRGLAFMGQQWWDEAIADFRRALEMGLTEADVFANLARSYRLKGWWDESIHFWGAALELNDDNADYFFNRGLAYFYKGWFNEAIEHFLAATHVNPADPAISYALAVALRCRGQVEEAARFLDKSVEHGGDVYRKLFETFEANVEITKDMMEAVSGKKSSRKAAPKNAAPKKEAAKKATSKKATSKKAAPKKAAPKKAASKAGGKSRKKGSMLDAAEHLLEEAGHGLHYKVLTREAISRKLIDTTGTTPEQSMRSAISRDISRKGENARFVRDKDNKGYYLLTKWLKK